MDFEAIQRFNDIGFCIQFGIVIVGCISTPLIPLFLWRVNIGSKSNQRDDPIRKNTIVYIFINMITI